jgi:hypothetical protein
MTARFSAAIMLLLSLTVLFWGCKSDTVTNSSGITSLDTSSFKYPLKQGSTWSFTRTISASDIHPDSILHYFSNYPLKSSGTITALYDTSINGTSTTCLLETYTTTEYTNVSRHYMINTDTAYIEYAARGLGYFVSFLKPEFHNYGYSQIDNNSWPNEEIRINNPPYEILKYPVVTGNEWTAYKNYGLIRVISKKYEGWQTLQIQGQFINCMKTRCILDIIPESPYFAYYSRFGILKQYAFLDNCIFATEWNPEGIGTVDITDTYTIISFNIP